MFVSVKFRDGDSRAYTYSCNLPVKPGDRVMVDTKDGQKIVTVVAIDHPEPAFDCKPITGIAPPKPDRQQDDSYDGSAQ